MRNRPWHDEETSKQGILFLPVHTVGLLQPGNSGNVKPSVLSVTHDCLNLLLCCRDKILKKKGKLQDDLVISTIAVMFI